jgi:peptidoglycan L-alanyl-D-glutamate endopeptidase CwlK
MRIEDMVAAVQQALGVGVDGRAGPETWTAIHRHVVGPLPAPAVKPTDVHDLANARSEAVISTLLPEVRPSTSACSKQRATCPVPTSTRRWAW